MLNWRMVLTGVVEMEAPVRVMQVREKFKTNQPNASRLLHLLHQWGYLRYANVQQRGYGGYEVTAAGEKLVNQWEVGGVTLTNTPGFHQRCKQCTLEQWRERSESEDGEARS